MKIKALILAALLTLLLSATAYAQTFLCTVDGGQMVCTPFDVEVLTPTATVEPTIAPPTDTPVPPTATPEPPATSTPDHNHGAMYWHPPAAHGNTTVHEHGDAPPQWVVDFNGGQPAFEHVAGTPNENNHDAAWWKHTAFKGWAGRFHNVDWYGIFHLDFNPSGHVSRFHSYQIWFRDPTGAVSHMHGWLDFGVGANEAPNLVLGCGTDSPTRPIIMANTNDCPANRVTFESWYARAGGSWVDFGFNINPNYRAGGDPANPATWSALGVKNLERRIEFAYYARAGRPTGEFWATQFAERVSGPNDALCGTTVTTGNRTYTRVCLRQYVAPTLPTIGFPGNSVQTIFPGAGVVQYPN